MNQQPRKDKSGKRWNFRIWYDAWTEERALIAERLFFWDDKKPVVEWYCSRRGPRYISLA